MSCVTCYVSRVGCHPSLVLSPTAIVTIPPHANSPIMHSRLDCKEPKIQKSHNSMQKVIETTKNKNF